MSIISVFLLDVNKIAIVQLVLSVVLEVAFFPNVAWVTLSVLLESDVSMGCAYLRDVVLIAIVGMEKCVRLDDALPIVVSMMSTVVLKFSVLGVSVFLILYVERKKTALVVSHV